jgi:hypothetical protein
MGGTLGLAISSILSLSGTLQWGMRQSAETENLMTSVERAIEYSHLESEAELDSKPGKLIVCSHRTQIVLPGIAWKMVCVKTIINISDQIRSHRKNGRQKGRLNLETFPLPTTTSLF